MLNDGVPAAAALSVLLCAAWLVVFVVTALVWQRGFNPSLRRPGAERLDKGWFAAMLVLLVGLIILATAYAGGKFN